MLSNPSTLHLARVLCAASACLRGAAWSSRGAFTQARTSTEDPAAHTLCPSTQRFSAVLNTHRSQYPDAVWQKVGNLFPPGAVAIDIAIGSGGRVGVELAQRGYRVLNVVSRMALQEEFQLIQSDAVDLITAMHGQNPVWSHENPHPLLEAHRILKPGGKLVVAWNERIDTSPEGDFVEQLEEVIERHVPAYSRAAFHSPHVPQGWAPVLHKNDLFQLCEYDTHANPTELSLEQLASILHSQHYIVEGLQGGARREAFAADVKALVAARFGPQSPVLLPLWTSFFVLEKEDLQELNFMLHR